MPGALTAEMRDEAKITFLEVLSRTGRVMEAVYASGVSYKTIWELRQKDPVMEQAVEIARKRYGETIDKEIHRRGMGWRAPILYQGQQVMIREDPNDPESKMIPLFEHKASDMLLLRHAQRHIPEYRDHMQVDHSHRHGVLVVEAPASTVAEWLGRHGKRAEDLVEEEEN